MLHIRDLNEGLEVFKTLGSDVRMRIVELLSERGEMNMNELAVALELTNGALTAHIRRLEECGIIRTVSECAGHGTQKRCSIRTDQILLTARRLEEQQEIQIGESEVPIGQFDAHFVSPPCGMCSINSPIGVENDVRNFSYQERFQAGLLWFSRGYVEYRIPNTLTEDQKVAQLVIYFEISSDRAGEAEECCADIAFYLNDQKLAVWTTPPEFRWEKGIYTPRWFHGRERQSGLMKMIVINGGGVYFDGVKMSDTPIGTLLPEGQEEFRFRIASENQGKHRGGIILYGSGFGNYNQDIRVRLHYTKEGSQ